MITFAGILFFLKRTRFFVVDHWRKALVLFALILLIAGVIFVFRYCERKKIEDKQGESGNTNAEVIKTESETNQAMNNLTNSNQQSREALERLENSNREAANAQKQETNVSFEEANRNRCLAFPSAKGCV